MLTDHRTRGTYRTLGSIVVAVFLLVGFFAAAPIANVAAAPTRAAPAPHEAHKVTLAETSIDGPAFWTNAPNGMPGAPADNLVAWTGTDAAHHLNLMRVNHTSSGYSFDHKRTLPESSFVHPALVVQPEQDVPYEVYLAWAGTNSTHSLNVRYESGTTQIKLTLWNESTDNAPAIALYKNKIWLAWTGTDANHTLNVMDLSLSNGRLVAGHKTVLTSYTSRFGPSLANDPNQEQLVLAWATTPASKIDVASSLDGAKWVRPLPAPLAEWSANAPTLISYMTYEPNTPHYYLAWTGIDPAHSVNVWGTGIFPQWQYPAANKATLPESAIGSPALGGINTSPTQTPVTVMWTGTDQQHHLNFAEIVEA